MKKTLILITFLWAAAASAEDKAANPITTHNAFLYRGIKGILLRSAALMPEENYAFKPTDAVRTYGQILGHVADAQYLFCSAARGEKPPAEKVEKTKTTKAELTAALEAAFAYCEAVYGSLNDTTAAESVSFHGAPTPKVGVLVVNNVHTIEHYGNLVTYMRMKNIVPPTSDPEFLKQISKR